jgi:hypothetical protein
MSEVRRSEVEQAVYFGCARGVWGHREAGHYAYSPSGRSGGRYGDPIGPWKHVDGTLAPMDGYRREAPQGHAVLHHKDGWTALSFWDRSGDSRGNSNSNFFFDATLTFEEALAAARERFPDLFARFPFEVVEWGVRDVA